jgi:hypothetical protein
MPIPKAGQHFRNTAALVRLFNISKRHSCIKMVSVGSANIYNFFHHLGPALGFVPIAVHFDLFGCLQEISKPATAQDVCEVYMKKYGASNLCTLFHH